MDGERVGASIERLRELAGMSRDELGEAVGISAASVRAIERGDAVPSPAFVAAATAAMAARLRDTTHDAGA